MERRRGLMQDSAIIYFDFSTSVSSYNEILDSLGREMSPVRTLDIRCMDFETLPVEPLLHMIEQRTQLQRVMLTYPENWPASKASLLVRSISNNPNIDTVWLSEIQSFSRSLHTILAGGLIKVKKLLLSMDQLRASSSSIRQQTTEALRVHLESISNDSTVTLCDVRFNRTIFLPIYHGVTKSAASLEFRWCTFDTEAMHLFESLYTQGKEKQLAISFESIRNPFPVRESAVFRTILGAGSSICKFKVDTFLKGMTDFSLTLEAIQASRHIRHLSLQHIDSPEKYRAVAHILPKMPSLKTFSFSVGEIQVPRSLLIKAIHASISLERVNGKHFDKRERNLVEHICARNKRLKHFTNKPCAVDWHLWPAIYAAASKCENGHTLILKTLLFLGDAVGPESKRISS